MKIPTLPAPAMATFISVTPLGAAVELGIEVAQAVLAAEHVEDVALLADQLGAGELGVPAPRHRDHPEAVALVDLGELVPRPRRRDVVLDQAELTARIGPVGVGLLG